MLPPDHPGRGHYWEAFRWENEHAEQGRSVAEPPSDTLVVVLEAAFAGRAEPAKGRLSQDRALAGRFLSVPGGSVRGVNDTAETRQIATAYVESLERRDWSRVAGTLAEDVVYEMPQTRERIRGRSAFLRFTMDYPGDWHLRVRHVVADGRLAALWLDARVGADGLDACVWVAVGEHGLISRITDYWPEPYDPPPGREHLVEHW